MDGNGNAIAVWSQYAGTTYDIYANRYVVGFGWGTAELIENDNFGDALEPQVAVDASGNATAVWHQNDGALDNIWANRYIVGVGWGTASLIETDNAGHADDPQVANDGSGNAMAVWSQNDGIRYNIYANRYIVGFGWGTASLIETDNLANAEEPQVGMDAVGNAIAVWHQSTGALWNIWTNRFEIGVGWGTASLLESDNAGDAIRPHVVIEDNGIAVAAWQQNDGARSNIWANRYEIGLGWGTPILIETENTDNAINARPAVDGNGNIVVVFGIWGGTEWNIWANQYDSMTGWGTATILETENAGDAFNPEVAMNPSGNAVTVWYQDDGTRDNIWANRYIKPDTTAPDVILTNPTDGLTTDVSTVTVSGTTEPGVQLTVNGLIVNVESNGTFEFQLALLEGENVITATATDSSDNTATDSVTVNYTIPASNLETELQETKDELNQTRDELADVMDALNQTRDEMAEIFDALNQTKDDLADVMDTLNQIEYNPSDILDTLNQTIDELADVMDALNQTKDDLSGLMDALNQTQDEITDLMDNINQTTDDLKTTNDEMNQTQADLAATQTQLNNAITQIQTLENDLNDTETEIQSIQTELEDIKSQLGEGGEEKDSQDMQTLLIPIFMFIILLVIILVAYMNLAKKIANMGNTSTKLPEESLEPETHIEEEEMENKEE